ncbi:pollen-specific leucine-rich repeat extensin-like protein 2 [Pteropus medius]|uniref:pollen-specific leucine-rich repeat extensin-like protein 2 n=1 Tax=Pteropus vampyrus TaxID=132908 RepID=UPI00196B7AE4|nr:pollen-specific leucine-rich repeat extensin-like protein 2 [Pteropus giganteus]
MGHASSNPTPLRCLVDNFKDFRRRPKVMGWPTSTSAPQKPPEPVLQDSPEDPEIPNPPPYYSPGNHFKPPESREAAPLRSPPHTRTGAVYYPPQDPDPIPDSSQPAAVLAPVRQIAPPGGDTQTSFMVYVPFSTSDLYNWKLQTLSFSEKPQGLTSLLESIFFTHQAMWDNCQQLSQVLFTTEEKERILREAARGVSDPTGQPTTDPARVQLVFPSTQPNCNPNTDQVLIGTTLCKEGDSTLNLRRPGEPWTIT